MAECDGFMAELFGGISPKSRQALLIVAKPYEARMWLASLLRGFYGETYLVIPYIPSLLGGITPNLAIYFVTCPITV
jgi:hypothetical protein